MFHVYAMLFRAEALVSDFNYVMLCILQIFVPPLKNSKKCCTLDVSSIALVNLEKCRLRDQLECNSVDDMGNASISNINESTCKVANVNFTSNSTEHNGQNVEHVQILSINYDLDVNSLKPKPIFGKKYENDYMYDCSKTKADVECTDNTCNGETFDQQNVNLSHEFNIAEPIVYGNFEIQFSPLSAFDDDETATEFAKDINTGNCEDFTKAVGSMSNKEIKQCDSEAKFISSPFKQDSAIKNFNTNYSDVLCNLKVTDSIAEVENSEFKMIYEQCPNDYANKDFPKFSVQVENKKDLEEFNPSTDEPQAKSSFIGSLNNCNDESLTLFCSNVENRFRKKVCFDGKGIAWTKKEFHSTNIIDPNLHTGKIHKSHVLAKDTYHNLPCFKTKKRQEFHFDEYGVYENNQFFEIITENSNISNNNKNERNDKGSYEQILMRDNNLFEGCGETLEICKSCGIDANQRCRVPSSSECFLDDNISEFVDVHLENSKEIIFSELDESIFDEDTSGTLYSTRPNSLSNCDDSANNVQYTPSDLKKCSLIHKNGGKETFGLLSLEYSEFSEALLTNSNLTFHTHIKPSHVSAIAY